MRLACVQTDISIAHLDENLERVISRVSEAAASSADLVVFPECMLCGYAYESRDEALANATEISGPVFAQLTDLAANHGLHFTLGFLEKTGDQLFNAAAMIGPAGVCGHYRKIHLPHLGVDRFVDRGDLPYRTGAAGGVNVGLAICYDSSFPEPMRVLALEGADVIALGTNWPTPAERTAEIVPPARSMENHLYFVAANRVGSERGFTFFGRSSICGPDGIVYAQAEGDDEIILYADVDPQLARNKRIERTAGKHVIDRFKDRQPDRYGRIVEP